MTNVPVQGLGGGGGGHVFLMHLTFNYCQTYFTTPTVSMTCVFVLIIYEHINDLSHNHLIMYVLITINCLMFIVVNASPPRVRLDTIMFLSIRMCLLVIILDSL